MNDKMRDEFYEICNHIDDSMYKQLPACENMVNTFEEKWKNHGLTMYMKGMINAKYKLGQYHDEVLEKLKRNFQ